MGRKLKTEEQINKEYEIKAHAKVIAVTSQYKAYANNEIEKVQKKWDKKRDVVITRSLKNLDRKKDNALKARGYKKGKIIAKKPLNSAKKKKLLSIIQKYVVYRDTDEQGYGNCIYCNCLLHIVKKINLRSANGCHLITSSKNATAFLEKNINLGCNGCNLADAQGNLEAKHNYRVNIDIKYGEGTYDEIYLQARNLLNIGDLKKIYGMDIDELLVYRKNKLDEIMKTKFM